MTTSTSTPTNPRRYNWPNNYPTYRELRDYFDHCDKVLNIKSHTAFESVVVGAEFDTVEGRWHVKTADGRTAKVKYLVIAAGFAAKRHVPDWPGIEKFKGFVSHSSFWPDDEIDVRGKKCAIIGTGILIIGISRRCILTTNFINVGASGVQITQAWGPTAGHLKVFQRTPNLTVPMRLRNLTIEEQNEGKKWYPELFKLRMLSSSSSSHAKHETNLPSV